MVAVVQVNFSRRRVYRVHLVLHLLHGQAARCQPAAAFLTHPRVYRVHLVLHLLHGQAARCQPAAAFLTHPGQPGFHFPAGRASAPAPAGPPHCHRLRRRTAEGHPPPCGHPAAQRVGQIATFDQRLFILCPRVVHQPVLTVVMVPVSPLIIRADTPFRDEVGFLCQPAVTACSAPAGADCRNGTGESAHHPCGYPLPG